MPIKIPDSLPARATLEDENIFVMTELRAVGQDIRPLKLLILNLMPNKIATETQLLRQLSNSPLQIEVDLLQTISHVSKNTDKTHLDSFYCSFAQIRDKRYDGMIITGAPVENMDFESVDYWPELCEIMTWTRSNVHSTLHICWGAQAGLYFHHSILKHSLPQKLFGVYQHKLLQKHSPLFRGFDDRFFVPHSRHTETKAEEILPKKQLELLAVSDKAGVFAIRSRDDRQLFITGHPEYDATTLSQEYFRDKERGLDIALPENYFPHNNTALQPEVSWRSHAQLLYSNWLNYYVYQTTPYDLDAIGKRQA